MLASLKNIPKKQRYLVSSRIFFFCEGVLVNYPTRNFITRKLSYKTLKQKSQDTKLEHGHQSPNWSAMNWQKFCRTCYVLDKPVIPLQKC